MLKNDTVWVAQNNIHAREGPRDCEQSSALLVESWHVVTRSRDDCYAPAIIGMGIMTGLAVMLMLFVPGIFFLYAVTLALSPFWSCAAVDGTCQSFVLLRLLERF